MINLNKEIDASVEQCYAFIKKEKTAPKRLYDKNLNQMLNITTNLRKMKKQVNLQISKNEYAQQIAMLDDYLTKYYNKNLMLQLQLDCCRMSNLGKVDDAEPELYICCFLQNDILIL